MLTDHNSGRSDRVVVEWEMDDLAEMDRGMASAMEKPEVQEAFGQWESKLIELIHYSEVENWAIR